ncbi:hypothetical protein Tco_0665582 [Tanacetum coccineum]
MVVSPEVESPAMEVESLGETKEIEKEVAEGGWMVVTHATSREKTESGLQRVLGACLPSNGVRIVASVGVPTQKALVRKLFQLGRMSPTVNVAANGSVKHTIKCHDQGGKMCSNTLAMIKNFTDTKETKFKLKEDKEEEDKANVWANWLTKRDKKWQSGGTIPDVTGTADGSGKYTTVKPK